MPGFGLLRDTKRLGVSMTSINLGDFWEYLAGFSTGGLCEVRLPLESGAKSVIVCS